MTADTDATAERITHLDGDTEVFHNCALSTDPAAGGVRRPGGRAKLCAMTTQRQAVGAYGEEVAAQHLQEQGLVVLDRNWRCADGEVDLVLRDGHDIVFCEVKTRRGDRFGPPAAAVTYRKMRKLRQLALRWLAVAGVHPREIRFDVVEVLVPAEGPGQVTHIRAAF